MTLITVLKYGTKIHGERTEYVQLIHQ